MNDLKERLLEAVAANLREFGYPSCTTKNVITDRVYRMFARRQIEDYRDERTDGKNNAFRACEEILAKMDVAETKQ